MICHRDMCGYVFQHVFVTDIDVWITINQSEVIMVMAEIYGSGVQSQQNLRREMCLAYSPNAELSHIYVRKRCD